MMAVGAAARSRRGGRRGQGLEEGVQLAAGAAPPAEGHLGQGVDAWAGHWSTVLGELVAACKAASEWVG